MGTEASPGLSGFWTRYHTPGTSPSPSASEQDMPGLTWGAPDEAVRGGAPLIRLPLLKHACIYVGLLSAFAALAVWIWMRMQKKDGSGKEASNESRVLVMVERESKAS